MQRISKGSREITILMEGLDENMVLLPNYISTCKYTAVSFIPKNLFEQFQRPEALWFLAISILQSLPLNLSPLSSWGTLAPLCLILFVSMLKDAYYNYKRRRSDEEINHRRAEVIDETDYERRFVYWQDIRVGWLVNLKANEPVPADIVIFNTSDKHGHACVETSNIDGESSFQQKHALEQTKSIFEGNTDIKDKIIKFKGATLEVEEPDEQLNHFTGHLKLKELVDNIPISIKNLILRGSKIKNVEKVLGVVVFAGHDTKLMKNAEVSNKQKNTKVNKRMGQLLRWIFGELFTLTILSTILSVSYYYESEHQNSIYSSKVSNIYLNIFTFAILFNNLVPISLYVTLDFVRLCQAWFIENDKELFSHRKPVVKSSDLIEDLGQIEYILADKTGTLTENIMKFKKCWILGNYFEESDFTYPCHFMPHPSVSLSYSSEVIESPLFHTETEEFWVCVAICHTVKCDENGKYFGLSPDEVALVEAASNFAYKFKGNEYKIYNVQTESQNYEYSKIGVNNFTSERKRMSVVVEFYSPRKSAMIICKGADDVMFERINYSLLKEEAQEAVEKFSKEGLRTLVYGKRVLSEEDLDTFKHNYNDAKHSISDRQRMFDNVADKYERDFELFAVVGVEDKVQDLVAESVSTLKKAGIKIWMLTGDKRENAENVAISSTIISSDADIIRIESINNSEIYSIILKNLLILCFPQLYMQISSEDIPEIENALERLEIEEQPMELNKEACLSISGSAITKIFQETKCLKYFTVLAAVCESVICCRVSPCQKAQMVKLIKNHFRFKPVTLAIGDGSNDVCMLQEANIGIGIMGKEGMHAANSSDFNICKFSDLTTLLLKHGNWNYYRITKVILLSLYKNSLLVFPMFFYTFVNFYSGSSLYDALLIISYNIFMTSVPIIVIGCMDKDISNEQQLEKPEIYGRGIKSSLMNLQQFIKWKILGLFGSIIIFIPIIYNSPIISSEGLTESYNTSGTLAFMEAVIMTLGVYLIVTIEWNIIFILSILLSLASLLLIIYAYDATGVLNNEITGVLYILFSSIQLGLNLILLPAISLIFAFVVVHGKFLWRTVKPNHNHRVLPSEVSMSQFTLNRAEHYKLNSLSAQLSSFTNNIFRVFNADNVKTLINRAQEQRQNDFERARLTQKFLNKSIEETFSLYRSDRSIGYVRKMLMLLLSGIIIWTVYDIVKTPQLDLLIVRLVLLFLTALGLISTYTKLFHQNFNASLLLLIACGLISKTFVEFSYEIDGSMSTATGSIIIFIIFRTNTYQALIIWVGYLMIYLPRVFTMNSINRSSGFVLSLTTNYSVVLIGISLVSAYVGFTIENSNRETYVMLKECEAKYKISNKILSRLLPEFVAEDIKKKKNIVKSSNVTILFCEICDFDLITTHYDPQEFIDILNKYTLILDNLCEEYSVTKIETVNKTYVACDGLNNGITENHGIKMLKFALAIIDRFSEFYLPKVQKNFGVKIGINSGDIVCGVVGEHKPQFCLVGDSINIASRMCTTLKEPNKIRISDTTYNLAKSMDLKPLVDVITFKGRNGPVQTYIYQSNMRRESRVNSFEHIKVENLIENSQKNRRLDDNLNSEQESSIGAPKRLLSLFEIEFIKTDDFKSSETNDYFGGGNEFYLFSEMIQWNVLTYHEDKSQKVYRKDFLLRNQKTIKRGLIMTVFIDSCIAINYILHYFLFSAQANTTNVICIIMRFICASLLLITILNLNSILPRRFYQWLMVFIYIFLSLIQIASSCVETDINYILILECMYTSVAMGHSSGLLFGYVLAVSIPNLFLWALLANAHKITYFDELFFIVFFLIINAVASWAREYYDRETYNLRVKAKAAISRTEKLLVQIIPDDVYEKLTLGKPILDKLNDITILYADICGFTSYSASRPPQDIVAMLSQVFTAFEKLCIDNKCYKVHTIGDCYVALGINSIHENNHIEKTECVVQFAISMVKKIKEIKNINNLKMRIGIHTGTTTAGIVGSKIVRYDIYGPDVDITNLVESAGEAGKINVSEKTKAVLEQSCAGKYVFEKNKSITHMPSGKTLNTYFLALNKDFI